MESEHEETMPNEEVKHIGESTLQPQTPKIALLECADDQPVIHKEESQRDDQQLGIEAYAFTFIENTWSNSAEKYSQQLLD